MAMSFFLRIIPVILIIGLHNGVDIDESIPYIVYNTMPGKNGSMGCAAQVMMTMPKAGANGLDISA
jgi:hypothetical protein